VKIYLRLFQWVVEEKMCLFRSHCSICTALEFRNTHCKLLWFNTTHYTDAKRKCTLDRNPPHLPHAVTFLPLFYFQTLLVQSSHSFHTKVGGANHVATLASDMHFGLADIQQETRESYTVGKNELSHALSTPSSMALPSVVLILQQLWHTSRWLLVSIMSVGMQQYTRTEPHLTHINTKHDKRRRYITVFRS